ncbi:MULTISPECIES: TIGR02808 family protein [Vibrio]|mgnify:CR=1 FL=1|nr:MULTISPECIES: TIGR02808 family protein [Vibrio]MBD1573342.1 TIGR02808 family protein [Vibrio sp. S17_S38]
MGTLEYVMWHVLGYAAMPVIILGGFAAVAAICIFILSMTKDKQID